MAHTLRAHLKAHRIAPHWQLSVMNPQLVSIDGAVRCQDHGVPAPVWGGLFRYVEQKHRLATLSPSMSAITAAHPHNLPLPATHSNAPAHFACMDGPPSVWTRPWCGPEMMPPLARVPSKIFTPAGGQEGGPAVVRPRCLRLHPRRTTPHTQTQMLHTFSASPLC